MPFLVGSRVPFRAISADIDPNIPSSISRLFHTNSIPSPMDVHRIHELLTERNKELSDVAEEIERARAELQRLEITRDQAEGIVGELEALLSPVRRMPMDIMANVFEHCVWDQAMPKADARLAPLLLGQVCRSWRCLLFSLPCLWTMLHLDFPSGAKDWDAVMQSKTMTMHVWFSRAKATPISLFLNHPKGSHIPWHALMYLDREILALSCRLKDLTLHFSPRSLSCLLTFTQSSLPYLQHLELQNSNSLPSNEIPPAIALHSAPSLRSLTISWCSLDLQHFRIPWSQLQELNLQYEASSFWNPVQSDYLQVLSQCPNLTLLFLGIGAPINDLDLMSILPVTLSKVHTFKLSVYLQNPYLQHFFDAIHMPGLQSFEIKNVSLALGSFTGQTECLPFLEKCADTLRSVCFSRIDIPDAAIIPCLAQLHHVTTMLYLPGILRLNHGLMTALTGNRSSTDSDDVSHSQFICPRLQRLHLRCSSVVPVDDIARLVESRCRTEPKLEHFLLQFATYEYGLDTSDEKIKELQARLQGCVEGGLHLALTKSSYLG
ncbi:hypothetical protein PAXRUDRAFT_9574 [Paxillus rubicundulus Ve08.2h10]|uniref:F-box domain-containing protein n=1 Tax=Paxillus rubicundulus Ve08.2h10 TaxID=930991 RepID=A0A0D0E2T9_9AGAM|nr:hypothetical protein PAXRUDRAFT_9574 [Paxillus rubicundulus Ve08.2h10]